MNRDNENESEKITEQEWLSLMASIEEIRAMSEQSPERYDSGDLSELR